MNGYTEAQIIENTQNAQDEFGPGEGVDEFTISSEQIQALQSGKCLAFRVNLGEYSVFLTMDEEQTDDKEEISSNTPEGAKQIIKSLGITGTDFSQMMGKNVNYVTDFNRYGVPENIQIILELCKELLSLGGNPKDIIKKVINKGKPLTLVSDKSKIL